jgi:hypothetical protein
MGKIDAELRRQRAQGQRFGHEVVQFDIGTARLFLCRTDHELDRGNDLEVVRITSEGGGAGPHVLAKFPGDLQRACSREDEVGGAHGKVAARIGAAGLDDDRS